LEDRDAEGGYRVSFRVYLSPPDVGLLEKDYVLRALDSGWVAPLGPEVDAFESEIGKFVGGSSAVALSSGTAALHLALKVAGVNAGDDVVVPTLTFAATAFAVTYLDARPIFLDVEAQSYNLDPSLLEQFLAERARSGRLPAAVIVVDIFGQAANYEELIPICAKYDVPLIEDAAEALGAFHLGQPAGSFGDCSVLSFNGNKIMTTSGGGMFLARNAEMAARVRHLATQARLPLPWYEHEEVGYNYRMSNILAALGRAQLHRLPDMITQRREHRTAYHASLQPHGIGVHMDAPWTLGNAWLTIARFDSRASTETVRQVLAESGIEARPVWKPMHRQPVFADNESLLNGVSDDLFAHGLCLPSGSSMTAEDRDQVVDLVLKSSQSAS
jgi:dTDP-4-amino-4,6-dideoxygalactose transaminase